MRTRCAPIAETRRDSSRSAPRVDDAAAGFQMGSRRDEVGVHRRGPHIACGRFRCGQAGDDARARVSGRSPRRRRRYARHARSHASKISLASVVDTECTSFGMPAGCRNSVTASGHGPQCCSALWQDADRQDNTLILVDSEGSFVDADQQPGAMASAGRQQAEHASRPARPMTETDPGIGGGNARESPREADG